MEMKKRLAHEITVWLHDEAAAVAAAEFFAKTVQEGEVPDDIPELTVTTKMSVLDLVMLSGVPSSKSEARRLIEQGGVELDGEKLTDPYAVTQTSEGQVLRVGRRNYFKIT